MAEVYLGEAVSVQGFKKKVAIKRVLPHLAQNASFIEMFLDEARLSARLNHTNIVTVFDISKREDTYFLIMEFVDGVNLKRILEGLSRRGQRIRLGDAIHLCIEACRALSYAHELCDESSKPLGIVHRDISPPNIMVTRRGEVKVADFGLAKASNQLQSTDPGVVKGKFSYLSPEAALGNPVDARADIFSLGIVLWEMLAGKRLFFGESDYATVKLVQNANIPRLSPLNREVDDAFEEVLLKALTREPGDRYQTAREFGEALSEYIFSRRLLVTSYDLAHLVQSITSEELGAAIDDPSLIDRLIQDELDGSVGIGSRGAAMAPRPAVREAVLGPGESYENPENWFSHDDDLVGAAAQKARVSGVPAERRALSGSWREAGKPIEPSASRPPPLPAARDPRKGTPPPPLAPSAPEIPAKSLAQSLDVEFDEATSVAPASRALKLKYVVVALIAALGVAAAAWAAHM